MVGSEDPCSHSGRLMAPGLRRTQVRARLLFVAAVASRSSPEVRAVCPLKYPIGCEAGIVSSSKDLQRGRLPYTVTPALTPETPRHVLVRPEVRYAP
jgi:hypothetical protein